MDTWYASSSSSGSGKSGTAIGNKSTRVFLFIWALCATIACICLFSSSAAGGALSSSGSSSGNSKTLTQTQRMNAVNEHYYKHEFEGGTGEVEGGRDSGLQRLRRVGEKEGGAGAGAGGAEAEGRELGDQYEVGASCPYNWHGNGSPTSFPRGRCVLRVCVCVCMCVYVCVYAAYTLATLLFNGICTNPPSSSAVAGAVGTAIACARRPWQSMPSSNTPPPLPLLELQLLPLLLLTC